MRQEYASGYVESGSLTDRQERFCQEYLLDLNATAAALRAGYKARSARSTGVYLLTHPAVCLRLAALQRARAARTQVDVDTVLREILLIATSDVRHFVVADDGTLALSADAPDHAWRAVASVKHRTILRGKGDDTEVIREIEYRLWPKVDALKLLAEHLGLIGRRPLDEGSPDQVHDYRTLSREARRARLRDLATRGMLRLEA